MEGTGPLLLGQFEDALRRQSLQHGSPTESDDDGVAFPEKPEPSLLDHLKDNLPPVSNMTVQFLFHPLERYA